MNAEIEEKIAKLEARVEAIERRLRSEAPKQLASPAKTPREFLLEVNPTSDNDKTLTAGYYLEMILGRPSFNFDDIDEFYAQAKEAAPANRRDPPYQNVKRGYFREVGQRQVGKNARNAWALTNSGVKRVEGRFTSRARR